MDRGATAFLDEADIAKGDDIEDRIFEEIDACSELLVLFTRQSYQRPWLWIEIGAAKAQKKRTVGVLYGVSEGELEQIVGGKCTIFK